MGPAHLLEEGRWWAQINGDSHHLVFVAQRFDDERNKLRTTDAMVKPRKLIDALPISLAAKRGVAAWSKEELQRTAKS